MYGSVADRLDEKDIKWKKHKRRELVRECQFVRDLPPDVRDLPPDGARDLTNDKLNFNLDLDHTWLWTGICFVTNCVRLHSLKTERN